MGREYVVVVDPGHGGSDPGAAGAAGVLEATVVLEVGRRLVELLSGAELVERQERIRCVLTRSFDRTVTLQDRVRLAAVNRADLFVSVHANAGPAEAQGFEVWTSVGSTGADALATELWETWGRRFPGWRRRLDMTDGDPDREAGFYVLTRTHCPAVLVELGFLSNAAEERELSSPAHQQAMAAALAEGIRRHLWGPEVSMLRHREVARELAASAAEGLPPPRSCDMPEAQQSRVERLLLFLGRVINRRREEHGR